MTVCPAHLIYKVSKLLITNDNNIFGGVIYYLYLCGMKIIKLTNSMSGSDIYVNVDCVGHFYVNGNHTSVGITTHNNGGFRVKETPEEIVELINK
jgi:hypothetical protein